MEVKKYNPFVIIKPKPKPNPRLDLSPRLSLKLEAWL